MNEAQPSNVFDYGGSLARMGNDPELFRDMVGFLREDAPRWLKELRASLDARDSRRVRHAAHALKGLVANFGAWRAEKAARTVEQGADQQNWAELLAASRELAEAIAELLPALAPYVPAGDPA